MKKNLISFLLAFTFCCSVTAQPQWKFHIAYEDATGAKDTIWLIWDTTATFGIDTLLGEGNPGMDYNEFNVWTLTGLNHDTTKVVAYPYEYSFAGVFINAMNFVLPITIKWDSSLFHTPWLPPQPVGWINHARIDNNYFFGVWNNPWVPHYYDMTIDNKVIAPLPEMGPWFWQDWVHFPMQFIIYQDPTLGTPNANENQLKNLKLYPNPLQNADILTLTTFEEVNLLQIFDKHGCNVKYRIIETSLNQKFSTCKICLLGLNPGLYIIRIKTINNYYHEKIVKIN
jgi:hypothetical protein